MPRFSQGDVIDEQWELLEHLSDGGFGSVFRARYLLDGTEYALKLLYDGSPDSVGRELQRIDHPNVVKAHWASRFADGTWWLSTEFIDGPNLAQVIANESPIPLVRVHSLASQLLHGLAAFHPDEARIGELVENGTDLSEAEYEELLALRATGLVHRDIKPENLLLADEGRLVIVDFGISSRAGTERRTHSYTPGYLPPDFQMRWDPDVDRFAAGVVIYQLLCSGEMPYASDRVSEEPLDPREVRPEAPDDLAEFLMIACAAEAEDRFASTEEMVGMWSAIAAPRAPESHGLSASETPALSDDEMKDLIVQIVTDQGPIVCRDVYKAVRKIVGRDVPNSRLNRLTFQLVRERRRIRQQEPLGGGQMNKTVYVP